MNSCNQRQIDREDAGVADTDEEAEEHQEEPARDEAVLFRRETMMPVASEMVIVDIMNTVRRPILSPSHPQKKAPGTAPRPEASRIPPPSQ